MVALFVSVVACAIALPHAMRLDRVSPAVAAGMWAVSLALRAAAVLLVATMAVVWFPATALFSRISHWCWHEVLPGASQHVALNGHTVGDAASLLPALVLAGSVGWVSVQVWRAAGRVRALLRRAVIGRGPGQSLVLRDGQVVVAAAGLRRPQVVVSAGALVALDDEELAASLEHERGHIARRHRYVLLGGLTLRAVGRAIPGARRAYHELVFHLERDADAYAVAHSHSPAALASAICKAAAPGPYGVAPAMALRGPGQASRRVRELLQCTPGDVKPAKARVHLGATGVMSLVLAALVLSAPAAAVGLRLDAAPAHRCVD